MDSEYHQFEAPHRSSVRGEQKFKIEKGMRTIVVSVLYGVLVLLLLILLMVTGIKFSQLNTEVTEVKLHLERISHRTPSSSALHSDGTKPVQEVILSALVPVRGMCREGWVSFQSSCYLLSRAAVTWKKAEEQCHGHGAHLLVVNNVEELDYISKIVVISVNYWIGLVERDHEDHWSWVDGTDITSTQMFWDEGQPDNWDYRENGEDCGQIHASEKRKRKLWNDADCNLPYRFICEKRV